MTGPDNTLRRPLPPDWVDLGGGRTLPRELNRIRRRGLWVLALGALSPFALLITLSVVPTSTMLAIAGVMNELVWVHFRQISFEGCGDRCWARAYTLISTTFMWVSAAIVGALSLWASVNWFYTCEEALRRGASPFGLTSRGTISQGPRWWGYILLPLNLALLLVLIAWIGGSIYDAAGANWSGRRRGLNVPAVYSFYWTGVLVIVQVMVSFSIAFVSSMILHIWKSLRTRHGR